ncbi:MAG: hypothetical protein NXI31_14210 [bacterium]|nr:hypothetical protein [bacterium]
MIARSWHGSTTAGKARSYVQYLEEVVLVELRTIDGFRNMLVQRQAIDGGYGFTVTTLWDSMDAIERFAGDDPTVAVVPAAAQALLSSWESQVRHSEVVLQA